MLKLNNKQNSDENEILSTSLCREIYHIIFDDYETVEDENININD